MAKEKSLQGLRSEDKRKKCPECGGEVVFENEEIICKKCGLVIE